MTELKFKLTTDSKINAQGIKLFRIEATVDFKNGYNEIKKGTKGGWVESEKVNGNARVYDNAWVSDNAEVFGDAQVSGNAHVSGNAWVSDNAEVYGDAQVYGNAEVFGDAQVYGDARVYGDAQVYGNAEVFGDAQVSGNAHVSGNAWVSLKKAYTRGLFLSSSDNTITPVVVDQSKEHGFDSERDYKNLLVVGDYEISDIVPVGEKQTINIGGKDYEVTEELTKALENLKESE